MVGAFPGIANSDRWVEVASLSSDPRLVSAVAAASSYMHGCHRDGEFLLHLARTSGGAKELIHRLEEEPAMGKRDVALVREVLARLHEARRRRTDQ